MNSGAVFTNKMALDPRYADNNFVEPPLMREMILRIQEVVDVPLCIDSSVPGALEAGLMACEGRPLLNSVTGEEERLELVLPLVKKYNVPVVAISNDDTGISQDPDVRFAVAKKIVERAADFGIPAHDIVVDPVSYTHLDVYKRQTPHLPHEFLGIARAPACLGGHQPHPGDAMLFDLLLTCLLYTSRCV